MDINNGERGPQWGIWFSVPSHCRSIGRQPWKLGRRFQWFVRVQAGGCTGGGRAGGGGVYRWEQGWGRGRVGRLFTLHLSLSGMVFHRGRGGGGPGVDQCPYIYPVLCTSGVTSGRELQSRGDQRRGPDQLYPPPPPPKGQATKTGVQNIYLRPSISYTPATPCTQVVGRGRGGGGGGGY